MTSNGLVFDDFMRKLTPGAVTAGSSLPPVIGVRAAEEKPSRETDLYAWLLDQANELRSRRPDFIDWSELAEELDEIVALARTEVVSRLRTLLAHLLKWKYQAERRDERSWKTTVVNQRLDLSLLLESKNLRNFLAQKGFAKAYEQAREAAGDQIQLERHVWQSLFPEACEWDSETALNNEFFPSPPASDSNGHSR